MRLASIQAEGIQGVKDGEYRFSDSLTVITGESSSGKTSLLRAIVLAKEGLGSYGAPPNLKEYLAPKVERGRIAAKWRLNEAEQEAAGVSKGEVETTIELPNGPERKERVTKLAKFLGNYDASGHLGKLEYISANRELRAGFPISPLAMNPGLHVEDRVDRYSGLEAPIMDAWLASLAPVEETPKNGEAHRFAELKQFVSTLFPGLEPVSASTEKGAPLIYFGSNGASRSLQQLSSSEQQAVLIATLFWLFRIRDSVVLIDEPELHWSCTNHVPLVRRIAKLGPNNQLILATGSQEIVENAETVVRLEGGARPAAHPEQESKESGGALAPLSWGRSQLPAPTPTTPDPAPSWGSTTNAADPKSSWSTPAPVPTSHQTDDADAYAQLPAAIAQRYPTQASAPSYPSSIPSQSYAPPAHAPSYSVPPQSSSTYPPTTADPNSHGQQQTPSTSPNGEYAASTSHGCRLDARQFACFSVDLQRTSSNRAQVLQQCGFDEAGWAAECEAWRQRFTWDRAAWDNYQSMASYFRALMG